MSTKTIHTLIKKYFIAKKKIGQHKVVTNLQFIENTVSETCNTTRYPWTLWRGPPPRVTQLGRTEPRKGLKGSEVAGVIQLNLLQNKPFYECEEVGEGSQIKAEVSEEVMAVMHQEGAREGRGSSSQRATVNRDQQVLTIYLSYLALGRERKGRNKLLSALYGLPW